MSSKHSPQPNIDAPSDFISDPKASTPCTEKAEEDVSPAPDGGLQAWFVAAGAACIFFSCLGFTNSFGVMQEYYMTHQLRGNSADAVAWIGSVSTFIQFAAGALSGPLFDRYGSWVSLPTITSGASLICL